MKFEATFFGRTKGAIGAYSRFTVEVEGSNKHDAYLNLYDTHQDIHMIKMEEVFNETENERD